MELIIVGFPYTYKAIWPEVHGAEFLQNWPIEPGPARRGWRWIGRRWRRLQTIRAVAHVLSHVQAPSFPEEVRYRRIRGNLRPPSEKTIFDLVQMLAVFKRLGPWVKLLGRERTQRPDAEKPNVLRHISIVLFLKPRVISWKLYFFCKMFFGLFGLDTVHVYDFDKQNFPPVTFIILKNWIFPQSCYDFENVELPQSCL